MQSVVRFYVYCQIKQHAPHPFAHRRSRRLRVGLAAVPCRRQTQSVNGNPYIRIGSALFTARSTPVSNRLPYPGCRVSPSVFIWRGALAIGPLHGVIGSQLSSVYGPRLDDTLALDIRVPATHAIRLLTTPMGGSYRFTATAGTVIGQNYK